MLCNCVDGLLNINIATDKDGHIIGNIISVEVILDVDQRRILQMLGITNGALLTVGVVLVKQVRQGVVRNAVAVIQCAVLFFVNNFELRVEKTEHGVDETVRFNGRPLFQAVGRQTYFVNCLFVPGVRIQATGPHNAVKLVKFIGDGVFGSLL